MSNEELLAKIGQSKDEETEFYTPMPPGYRKGHHKYVVVVGTVMSGLGKGIFASSLAKLLQDKGLKVAPIKMEGYLNIDSGTLNPYRHGEVFVLDDGMETDMDLGTYERLLDQDLSAANFTTNGQVLSQVLKKEREGGYLGRDVQVIPHLTGEIKLKLRELAVKSDADVVFVEVGGTVGDYENSFYLEACRQLAFEEGEGSVVFVALTYVLEPNALGEQKSKAAQLGIQRLMEVGIMPHIVACRARNVVGDKVRQKISMYTNVPMRRVFSMHDVESIYVIPESLREAGMDREVLTLLDLHERVDQRKEDQARMKWRWFVERIGKARKDVTIAVTGKYTALRDAYASIIKACEHCGVHQGVNINFKWLDTTTIDATNVDKRLGDCDGIIVPGGFGVRGTEGKIDCIRYARENKVPYLGLCLGFQMAVIEFARNVCGIADANSTEFDPRAINAVIDILPEQKKIEGLGGNMRLGGKDVEIKPETIAAKLFENSATLFDAHPRIRLRFRHRYEVDPRYIDTLESHGLVFSGKHPTQPIMQILELPPDVHPYFLGTQAHPELTSRPLRPQPMFMGFIQAAMEHHGKTRAHRPQPQTV
ncbi:MAG: CTP synthase [Tepidisphaeraceae bacterium]